MELQRVYEAIDYMMDRFRKMKVGDVGVFKICLVSFGILLGTYARRTCRRLAPILWITFIVSYVVLVYRLLIVPASGDAQR